MIAPGKTIPIGPLVKVARPIQIYIDPVLFVQESRARLLVIKNSSVVSVTEAFPI
jgi:hypothetical protein